MRCDPTLQYEVVGALAASSLKFSVTCAKDAEFAKLHSTVVVLLDYKLESL